MYTAFVIFKEERVDAIPFKIINDTPFTVAFAQDYEEKRKKGDDNSAADAPQRDTIVAPKLSEYFGYDNVMESLKVVAHCDELFGKGGTKKFKIAEIKMFKPFKDQNGYVVYNYVFTRGPTRVLVLTYNLLRLENECPLFRKAENEKDSKAVKAKARKEKNKKKKTKRKKKEDGDGHIEDEEEGEENDNEVEIISQSTVINIQSISVSLITKNSEDFLLLTILDFYLDFCTTSSSQTIEGRVQSVHLDNMKVDKAAYPVVIYGGPKHDAATDEERQWLRLSVVKSTQYKDMDYYTYASMLVQDIVLNLDMQFLADVLEFASSVPFEAFSSAQGLMAGMGEEQEKEQQQQQMRVLSAVTEWETVNDNVTINNETQDRMCYFELLHLNPVKIVLTFTSTTGAIPGMPPFRGASIVEALINTAGNLEKVPLKFNALLLENPFCPTSTLTQMIVSHYTHGMVVQALKLSGSVDLLGNPVGLFSSIGTGVLDFFYEPAQGLCQSPKAFGKGVAKGSKSLVKNTIYGVFNSLSKFTGTIGKGVANLSFDDEYIRKREASHLRQSKHVGDGLAKGMFAFGKGVFDGVTGIVTQPVKGARKEGAKGFAKGIGKGLVGVAAKPVAGAFEFVSKTTEGVKNTTTLFEEKPVPVRKYPRPFGPEGEILPYYKHDAEGAYIVSTTPELQGQQYYKHVNYSKGHVVFTNSAVAILGKALELKCVLPAREVVGPIECEQNKVIINGNDKKCKAVVKLTNEECNESESTVKQCIFAAYNSWINKYGPNTANGNNDKLCRVEYKVSRTALVKKKIK